MRVSWEWQVGYNTQGRQNQQVLTAACQLKQSQLKIRCGGASRVVTKAYRVTEAKAGVGKKPALYFWVSVWSMSLQALFGKREIDRGTQAQ